jgi:hypothetical protein
MKHFTTYLIELGYEPWRYTSIYSNQNADAKNQAQQILKNREKYEVVFVKGDEKEGDFYFKSTQPYYDFSSMRIGGIATYWVKDKDFNNSIIWGLREMDKPPTLIKPRPKIERYITENSTVFSFTEQSDDSMNMCLQKESPEKIYEALFNKNIVFKYGANN